MGTKFCFGNSPISSGYAIGYFGLAIRLFLIPNLIAVATYWIQDKKNEGTWHGFPTALVGLVMCGITLPIQVLLIFGIWKRIRALLCVWMVFAAIECAGIVIAMILPFVAPKSIIKWYMPSDVSKGYDVAALLMAPILSTCLVAFFVQIWLILVIYGAHNFMKEELMYPGPSAKYEEPATPSTIEDLHMTLSSNKLNLSRKRSRSRTTSRSSPVSNPNLDLANKKLDLEDQKLDLENPKLDLSKPQLEPKNQKLVDLSDQEVDPTLPGSPVPDPISDLFRPQT